jgi:hypothetical protein
LSAVRDCLFKVFAATLHIHRPFLHPQPEEAPWRCDRDRFIVVTGTDFNIIYESLRLKTTSTIDEYTKSGIYKLTCCTCNRFYVGQASRNLNQSYLEHITYIINNDPQSAYAAHILSNVQEYGNININMSLLKQVNKGPSMNSFEQFYFQLYSWNDKLVSEQSMGERNQLFLILVSPCIFRSSLFIKHRQNALHFTLLCINRPLHMFRFM